jgi:hypothetical protein
MENFSKATVCAGIYWLSRSSCDWVLNISDMVPVINRRESWSGSAAKEKN